MSIKKSLHHTSTVRLQVGFTLVELMVSMVLGLLMMISVVQLYIGITRNNSDMTTTNEQIENGRFVLQVLEQDLVHGGFWNGYIPMFDDLSFGDAPTDAPTAEPEPCKDFAAWTPDDRTNLLAIPVQVYSDVPAGCSALITDKKANTDVLVVRHADTCVPGAANCEADTIATANPKVYFQSNFCGDTAQSPYQYQLDKAGFANQKRDCVTAAERRKYVSNIYYISTGNVLKRLEFGSGGGSSWGVAQSLIEGVEGFAVELGVDYISDSGANVISGTDKYNQAIVWADATTKTSPTNRGDGAPDGDFLRCTTLAPCTFDQLANVVAVKIYVLVRGTTDTAGYDDAKSYVLGSVDATATHIPAFHDGFKRHVYSSVVRLNNVSARRQTP